MGGEQDLLRFLTCGSVDDGKSTLIGRLLFETGAVLDDQLEALAADSRRHGTRGDAIDYALLVDGLSAEREQGITIDVAYRFFATPTRKFIVADTPGHEQYTRNMVTGASTCEAAVLLVDARKGLLTQTRRHATIVRLLGIRHVILAINKMDLVGYDEDCFVQIVREFGAFAERIDLPHITPIPLSGVEGDNVVGPSPATPWYGGPSLLQALETVPVTSGGGSASFRLPVQWVNRPDGDFRGVSGLVASGQLRVGAPVTILPAGVTTRVAQVLAPDEADEAQEGQSVTLTFAGHVDCSRGDVVVESADPPQIADQFEAALVWMDGAEMLPGRAYLLKLATQTVTAQVQQPRHRLDVDTLEQRPARTLRLNEIGVVHLSTDRPLVFEPYERSRMLGGFILIDKLSNATVAAGIIRFALRRSQNLHWQPTTLDRDARARLLGQRPRLVWLTGLSGAGKSTIADLLEAKLATRGRHTFLLDGDNVRHGLNRDLGFTDADRVENIRRVGEVAKLMLDAGLIVITAFISPFRAERQMVRDLIGDAFLEVFVDTPLAEAERRDPKGLYRKARAGELQNFTGIGSPYEAPEQPDLRIDTLAMSPEQAADTILALLDR